MGQTAHKVVFLATPPATDHSLRIGNGVFRWGERTYVMGVVNMTPDSFSGDGLGLDVDAAVQQALRFQDEGADIVDVGGQSTRPPGRVYGEGAAEVSPEDEASRVVPVIQRMAGVLRIPISVDTFRAEVARQALDAGAAMINDVWGLRRDPDLARVSAKAGVPIILMYNQEGYAYRDLLADIIAGVRLSVWNAERAGVLSDKIIVDPGIGFGKDAAQSLELLRRLDEFKAALGKPMLVGTSRKSHIGLVLGGLPPQERVEGTAATVALAIAKGVDIVRVHDVKEMVRVARVADAIVRGWRKEGAQ
ncbi:MAG: dihydropteroate synthase [Dehalococcoidia bacterium]|nr:dihydropteroate synthase [Dehalococcoidia bacterium]